MLIDRDHPRDWATLAKALTETERLAFFAAYGIGLVDAEPEVVEMLYAAWRKDVAEDARAPSSIR